MKKTHIKPVILLFLMILSSCSDFLDEIPDNRLELDSKDKIRKLLTSAYPDNNHIIITELSSDNMDDIDENNPSTQRLYDELFLWQDVSDTGNDDPLSFWRESYNAIAHSNQALASIEKLNGEDLSAERGEALITRAYNHFNLVNVFAKHYNPNSSDTDLGIPYLTKPEVDLAPTYERETVAEVYKRIEADIKTALPLIDDNIYTIKTYHFNRNAAHAFAARFYLYYGKANEAYNHASFVVQNTPLRDWIALGNLARSVDVVGNAYISDVNNLLNITSVSSAGLVFGPYRISARYSHTRRIANTQTLMAPTPWSPDSTLSPFNNNSFNFDPFIYNAANFDKTLYPIVPYIFETTDPISRTGFSRTVSVPFTVEETLLVKAEALILLERYNEALVEINKWSNNFYTKDINVTLTDVNTFYNDLAYSTAQETNQKKELNPTTFTITNKDQENMLHYVLQCRRIATIHQGLRWFDIKRYGIEVDRLQYVPGTSPLEVREVGNKLTKNDLRRALQIPKDVISAGLTPNPR
ncbi:RagB/SusD family nutrient uptake outer membrane protein [Tenacibaculum mesophilum]|uniref:RagB/SusD family nutrient uptake outer membrane protein n=1 Tax=Tenacibaculum mesophilum TaxID=104268 RepID=UPI00064AFADC|nr:RagB/SusD family nutrient uptake outer membrane protein [Tenacibaculum mesophilum]BFF39309.1 RagB/SusD family nutrient uptake outer membrane protein [Tenacibaculum mesophilum]